MLANALKFEQDHIYFSHLVHLFILVVLVNYFSHVVHTILEKLGM